MKYYFVYKETDLMGKETGKTITHQFETDTLSDMLENFEDFLKGAGFHFEGHVDITNEDDIKAFSIDIHESEGDGVKHSPYYYDTDRNKQMSFDFRA